MRIWALAAGLAALSSVACSADRAPPIVTTPADAKQRQTEARQALDQAAEGFFRVHSFEPGTETTVQLYDEGPKRGANAAETRLVFFMLPFRATLEVTSELALEYRPVPEQGDANLTLEQVVQRVNRVGLLGRGEPLSPGDTQKIESFAFFDALRPGWRFRTFDRERLPNMRDYPGARFVDER